MKVLRRLASCVAAVGLVVTSGCAGAGSLGSSANEVTIALVSNSQMTDAQKLSSEFEKENPGTKLKFISLSENQARAKITMSSAMGGSEFDVVMISNFETPQWAKDGWLVNLSDYMKNTLRLAALMGLPSIFVYTHDSVGLGEDGHDQSERSGAVVDRHAEPVAQPARGFTDDSVDGEADAFD